MSACARSAAYSFSWQGLPIALNAYVWSCTQGPSFLELAADRGADHAEIDQSGIGLVDAVQREAVAGVVVLERHRERPLLPAGHRAQPISRSEDHTSELQSRFGISYA